MSPCPKFGISYKIESSLDFRNASVLEIPEDMFEGAIVLESVDLSQNFLKVIPSKIFENNGNLEILNVTRNQISELSPKLITKALKLVTFDASNNLLKAIPDNFFEGNILNFQMFLAVFINSYRTGKNSICRPLK